MSAGENQEQFNGEPKGAYVPDKVDTGEPKEAEGAQTMDIREPKGAKAMIALRKTAQQERLIGLSTSDNMKHSDGEPKGPVTVTTLTLGSLRGPRVF